MWNKVKETVNSKYFWIGFCEGFLVIPLFFGRPLYKKLLEKDRNDREEIRKRVKRIHGFK